MKLGIFPNLQKPKICSYLKNLLMYLNERGIQYCFPLTMKKELIEKEKFFHDVMYVSIPEMAESDIILSVGGDGSFLGAARSFSDYPVKMVGIHLGELGFLNSITPEDTKERINQLIEGKFHLEERVFLSSSITREDGLEERFMDVLNDIVIGHDRIGNLSRINLHINGDFIQEYAADGLVISTATGSTGYALSCGGPVLGPTDTNVIVIPICAHTLQRFGLVVSAKDEITITSPTRETILSISLDGAESHAFTPKDKLTIKATRKPIRFIRFDDQRFFATINKKLVRKVCES